MKLLTMMTLALLLFVGALAGLSPPTIKNERQSLFAFVVHPAPLAAQAVTVEQSALSSLKVNILGQAPDIALNQYKSHPATEVRPVARNGSRWPTRTDRRDGMLLLRTHPTQQRE